MTTSPDTQDALMAYKRLLAAVIDQRPSGTRQRLATALSKNRSFISQITNPAYAVPIPANHLEVIFEVCHFSAVERQEFLRNYATAHPRRAGQSADQQRLRAHTILLPDMGDAARNEALYGLVSDFVRQITNLMASQSNKGKSQ